jgi:CHAD domain-containing protein
VLTVAVTPVTIHRARVAARQLRVLLRAYRQELDPDGVKRYRRELQRVMRDLAAARDAYVARQAVAQLARNRNGKVKPNSRALYDRAVKRYESALFGLRLTIAAAPWQQRLRELHQLSERLALVKENDDFAVNVTDRLLNRRRRRLCDALIHAGRSPKKLHRVRLKVKAMRYLLDCCLPKRAAAGNPELKRLRQIQTCLGDMHDDENLLKLLRVERRHLDVARGIRAKLKARKAQRLHAFKRCRKGLVRLQQ